MTKKQLAGATNGQLLNNVTTEIIKDNNELETTGVVICEFMPNINKWSEGRALAHSRILSSNW